MSELKRKWEEKVKDEPWSELVCKIDPANVDGAYHNCNGPRCGHWNLNLEMCGFAAIGEIASFMWSISASIVALDAVVTDDIMDKTKVTTPNEVKEKLVRINELGQCIYDHLSLKGSQDELPPSQMKIWSNEIIRLSETKESKTGGDI